MHGARLPKLHAFHSPDPFFGTYLMFLFRFFCFRRPCRCPTKILSGHSMDTLNCAPDGASARSRSPSRSLEVAPQHPPTTPIRVTESQELVITHAPRQCACLGIGATTARGTGPGRLLVERLNWKAQRLNACHNDAASNVCEDVDELWRQHAIPESHAYNRSPRAHGRQKRERGDRSFK